MHSQLLDFEANLLDFELLDPTQIVWLETKPKPRYYKEPVEETGFDHHDQFSPRPEYVL